MITPDSQPEIPTDILDASVIVTPDSQPEVPADILDASVIVTPDSQPEVPTDILDTSVIVTSEVPTYILDTSVIVTPDSQPENTTDIPLSRFTFTPTGWPYPTNLTNVNGTLYFTANDSINGEELWKIDPMGTAVRVTDINPGANSSKISNLTNVDGTLYFHTYDSIHGRELWKIDPTGTAVLVNDINPFAESTLTNVNGNIYFTANKSINGSELWKINATGTAVLVTDFSSGTNSSYLSNLTSINGMLYFIATDYTHILHQYIETSGNRDQSVRKRAQNNINENSEHHSPVRPSSTLHIDGINAQSVPKQKPQSGLGNVLGTEKGSIAGTLRTQIGSSIESIYE